MRAPLSCGVAAASIVAVVTVTGCAGGSGSGGSHPTQTPSLSAASAQQVESLIRDWGSVAVQGMRPAIHDLSTPGGVPRAGIATEATAWIAALTHDREQLQGVDAPGSYEPTRRLLLRSLDGYLRAAAIVHGAAKQPDFQRREAALERAVRVLTAADALYEQARPSSR
jgi:hypothetical protein